MSTQSKMKVGGNEGKVDEKEKKTTEAKRHRARVTQREIRRPNGRS